MNIITVSHLSKSYSIYKKKPGFVGSLQSLFHREYEKVQAVSDISFTISEGELVGFIGPNGAGKTTTLKCLSGLLYPSQGYISVSGFSPFERKHNFLRQIALVMGQKNQLWWDLPAQETFLLQKEIYGIPHEKFKAVIFELATLLEVENSMSVPVKKLSLGQRMKMELIAALIHSPKVLFLDEPTIGLDVVMQKNLREFIKEYNRKYKATIILTSHYMGDVEELCKRVIIINNGKILFDGALSYLAKQHRPNKIVSIILGAYADLKIIDALGRIKRFHYPQIILEVPKEKVKYVLAKAIEILPIEDITITEPQIEDIIREVFTRK